MVVEQISGIPAVLLHNIYDNIYDNIERAIKMTAKGLMTQYGQALIDIAKTAGKWIIE